MLTRNEKGKLVLKSLYLQIFLGDLFEQCKNNSEIDWLREEITEHAECISEERMEEL